jgi:DNA-binding GntR family transcriptional regulator
VLVQHVRHASHVCAGHHVTAASSWQDIADTIRTRIASGTYPVGALIPSTTALGQEFGVSQGPVQRATALLRAEGLVVGEPGRGVRVVAAPVPPSVEGPPSLAVLAADVAELQRWRVEHERGHGG